uniref:Uncharacterized protein n=1 Tax=Anguilla anguilla TaxID=7936 RepID=A0A0E9PC40_ANGAN
MDLAADIPTGHEIIASPLKMETFYELLNNVRPIFFLSPGFAKL